MTIAIATAGGPIPLTATHAERSQRRERILGFPRVLIVGIGKGVKYDFASPGLCGLFAFVPAVDASGWR